MGSEVIEFGSKLSGSGDNSDSWINKALTKFIVEQIVSDGVAKTF